MKPALFPPIYYRVFEGDLPLGYHGKQAGIDAPPSSIYRDINVEMKLLQVFSKNDNYKIHKISCVISNLDLSMLHIFPVFLD